jgi:hypothetical protein
MVGTAFLYFHKNRPRAFANGQSCIIPVPVVTDIFSSESFRVSSYTCLLVFRSFLSLLSFTFAES